MRTFRFASRWIVGLTLMVVLELALGCTEVSNNPPASSKPSSPSESTKPRTPPEADPG